MTAGDLENLGCRRHKPPLQKVSYFFLDPPFFGGTLAPVFRAFDSPMAIACLRLVAFFPDRPLCRVPRFRACIASLTFCCAFLPYLAISFPPCAKPLQGRFQSYAPGKWC